MAKLVIVLALLGLAYWYWSGSREQPIEALEAARFTEVAYLLIYGKLPTAGELSAWRDKLTRHSLLHEDMKKFFNPRPRPLPISSSAWTRRSASAARRASSWSAGPCPGLSEDNG